MHAEQPGQRICSASSQAANQYSLQCRLHGAAAGQATFDGSEKEKRYQCDDDGSAQCGGGMQHDHVGEQGNESAGYVRERDDGCTLAGSVAGWFFEAKFKAHHKIDPGFWIALQSTQYGIAFGAFDPIFLENLVNLFFLVACALDDFPFFTPILAGVMLHVTAGRKISAQSHGDGSGS